jgi:hypothetical protein
MRKWPVREGIAAQHRREIGVTWVHEKPGKWDQLFRDRRSLLVFDGLNEYQFTM